MSEYLSTIIAAALVNNVVLVQYLGVSSLFAYSSKLQNALELALLSFVVMFPSSVINLLIQRYLLAPLHIESLELLSFVLVSSVVTSLVLQQMAKHRQLSMRRIGLEFYLLAGNSALVGISLLQSNSMLGLGLAIAQNFGAALGFVLLLIVFAALRQRLDTAAIPAPFRGAPIYLITAGIVSMCLFGFAGVA